MSASVQSVEPRLTPAMQELEASGARLANCKKALDDAFDALSRMNGDGEHIRRQLRWRLQRVFSVAPDRTDN